MLGKATLRQWTEAVRARIAGRRLRRRNAERREVARFCTKVVHPVLTQLSAEWRRVGRSVSVQRDAMTFHVTVWYERAVEFQYSVGATRRKPRRPSQSGVHPAATIYVKAPEKLYALSDIRRTDRHRFSREIIEQYRRSLARG